MHQSRKEYISTYKHNPNDDFCPLPEGELQTSTSRINSPEDQDEISFVNTDLELKTHSEQGDQGVVDNNHLSVPSSNSSRRKRFSRAISMDFIYGFIPRWTYHANKQSEARDLLATVSIPMHLHLNFIGAYSIGLGKNRVVNCGHRYCSV